jgi:hypothetical protein
MDELAHWEKYRTALEKPGETLILLDVSGSMDADHMPGSLGNPSPGPTMTRLEHAIKALDKVEGSIITFGYYVNPMIRQKPSFKQHVTGTGTPLREAFMATAAHKPRVVTVLSDGEPTGSSEQSVFDQAVALGVPVNCIFIGTDAGRELMLAIANATGGYFFEVGKDDVRSLHEELTDALSTLRLPAKCD